MTAPAAHSLATLQQRLGHTFKNPGLLQAAVTHPSASARSKEAARAYERLEFLGDRVLGLVVAEWLLELHPDINEGELARHHASAVKRDTLVKVAHSIDLLAVLKLGKGEAANERGQANILADATETVIAALYLDAGLRPTQKFIRQHFADLLHKDAKAPRDAKTALQEWAQARGGGVPTYEVVTRSGPVHAPEFTVRVKVGKDKVATATGKSKQAAEKQAAADLLARLTEKKTERKA